MESLLLLIPLSALVIIGAAAVFWWAVDAGQFEDVERQGRHSLFDESRHDDGPT
jgi:cbb3-type cytochrome oxidase maturation protein